MDRSRTKRLASLPHRTESAIGGHSRAWRWAGRLDWKNVRRVIERELAGMETEIMVYEAI